MPVVVTSRLVAGCCLAGLAAARNSRCRQRRLCCPSRSSNSGSSGCPHPPCALCSGGEHQPALHLKRKLPTLDPAPHREAGRRPGNPPADRQHAAHPTVVHPAAHRLDALDL